MTHLELYCFGDQTTLDVLKRIDTRHELRIGPRSCFWLGSVARDDKAAFERFLTAATAGDVLELKKSAAIADHMAYAVIVQDAVAVTSFHLVVFAVDPGLDADPRAIFAKKLPSQYCVKPKPETELPAALNPDPKKLYWSSFFEALVPFSGRRRGSRPKPRGDDEEG